MKSILVVVVVLGVVGFSYQDDNKMGKMRAEKQECLTETKADEALVKKAMMDGDFTNNAALKCFFKCMVVKMGKMSEDGTINIAAFKDHIPPQMDKEKATAAIEKCKDVTGSDACDKAFNLAKCLRQEAGPMMVHHE